MKTLISGLFLAVLWSLLSTSLYAQTEDGETPAEESVCDVLADGTPGLFGLCNAYCEAKDCDSYGDGEEPHSCNILLARYDDRRTGLDPEMPCEDVPTDPMCPCWSSEGEGNELDAGGMGLPPTICFFGGTAAPLFDVDFLAYFDTVNQVIFTTYVGGCGYVNSFDSVNRVEVGISAESEQACRDDILERSDDWINHPIGCITN